MIEPSWIPEIGDRVRVKLRSGYDDAVGRKGTVTQLSVRKKRRKAPRPHDVILRARVVFDVPLITYEHYIPWNDKTGKFEDFGADIFRRKIDEGHWYDVSELEPLNDGPLIYHS